MNVSFNHYAQKPEALAAACERGAANLREEAAEALKDGDQGRHDRKMAAAAFADDYAGKVLDGTADLDQAQVVAHAANMSGILIEPRMPDAEQAAQAERYPLTQKPQYDATVAYVQQHQAELSNAASAGLLSRVADDGQVPFYSLPGYEPDGYDSVTQTSSLRDRDADVDCA